MTGLDTLSAAYDAIAPTYADLLPDTSFEAPLDLAMLAEFTSRVPAGSRVLDAGCGTGRLIPSLLRTGAEVHGTDLSPGMVDLARRAHPEASFVTAPLDAQPFDDGVFSGVLAWYSIIHTAPADLAAVAREIRRLLVPGGVALLGFQVGRGERPIPRAYGLDVDLVAWLHEPADVGVVLDEAGLTTEIVLRRGPRPPSHPSGSTEKQPQGFVLARRD